ncbi:MAG: VWA domain-containing protein [bacterium]|nr:VWA domain-containing protein [bacterium]
MRSVLLRLVLVGACGLCLLGVSVAQEERDEPLELGIEEQVDVQLILVDFIVLDQQGRVVPDVKLEELMLKVDGTKRTIASLDIDCPAGRAPDARPTQADSPPPVPRPDEAEPRRYVLAFDYDHMGDVAETFDAALQMIDRRISDGDEHMIASLGEVVRIEAPFTAELDELRWTLRRMRNDRDLYAGQRGRLTEMRFYQRLASLFDLLERWPGRKTIVLFSGGFINDGFTYDDQYRKIAGMATATRTAVYPVDTAGLGVGGFGGPPHLRRLANETGGRMTANTNDIGLGYARAQRDANCTYTLGYYDEAPRPDRNRRMKIKVKKRKDLRTVYPDYYVVRSEEERRESLQLTASMAPHMFESDVIDFRSFVVGAASADTWRTVLGVEIRLGTDHDVESGELWQLDGFLRKPNGTIVHEFRRAIEMPPSSTDSRNPRVQLFHEVPAGPGQYAMSVILSDPAGQTPMAATKPVTLAKMPRSGPFLIGPVLGRRSNLPGAGAKNRGLPAFEPLIEPVTRQGVELDALTVLCVAGEENRAASQAKIARSVATLDGVDAQQFDAASVTLGGKGAVRCHEQLDALAMTELIPGSYEINVSAEGEDYVTEPSATEFTITAPAGR